jgi:steroid 5-alpha reductase family enzyme
MLLLFLNGAVIILILMSLLWVLSIYIKNVSIVDIFWGLGFVIVNGVYFFLSDGYYPRNIILLILVSIWGLRLSIYLAYRNIGKGEDFRYQEFRRHYGVNRYWWVSFFQVFLLQGVLILLVSLPLLGSNFYTDNNELMWLDYVAIIIWIIGFIFESFGDFQLTRFKNNPNNKGKVLDTGLWKYTRHPNYFGDTLVWWAYALFCLASGSYWPVVGSVLMTFLIIKVSGVALLEVSLKNKKPDYQEYVRKTNAFFPWFPKK